MGFPHKLLYISFKYFRTNRMAMAPSATAEEIPVNAEHRTSPEAKMPGTLVSGIKGSRSNFHTCRNDLTFINSAPVMINPFSSFKTRSFTQSVPGFVPI